MVRPAGWSSCGSFPTVLPFRLRPHYDEGREAQVMRSVDKFPDMKLHYHPFFLPQGESLLGGKRGSIFLV